MDALATKGDLKNLEEWFEARLEKLELRLTVKLGTFMAIAVGLLATLVKLL